MSIRYHRCVSRPARLLLCAALFAIAAGCSGIAPASCGENEPNAAASETFLLLEKEAFSQKAADVLAEYLQGRKAPYQLGLFDLQEDGIPEIMVQSYLGWGADCFFLDLTASDPAAEQIAIGWPAICLEAVYVQRSDGGIKWRIRGDSSHGFTQITSDNIVEIKNGKSRTIRFLCTRVLDSDRKPSSLSVETMIDSEQTESFTFDLRCVSEQEIESSLENSLFQFYMRQDWEKLDTPPWVLEETACEDASLAERIGALYDAWRAD